MSKMDKRLVIIGASGHGKVVADIADAMERYSEIMFLDDDESLESCNGYAVIGKSSELERYVNSTEIFVAIGNPKTRRKIQERLEELNAKIPILVHPTAVIGSGVEIGNGTVIMPGAIINAESSIGKGCIINTSASVDHDCQMGDFVHVSVGTHVAGNVKVGENTWLGISSSVSNNVNITSDCMIGAGAVIVKDIEEAGTYVGVPAKRIK